MTDPGNENSALDILRRNRDAYDTPIALSTENEADLPGHYPLNPERYRLIVNGSRAFFQYNTIPEVTDNTDGFEITPQNAGDVVTLRTAERTRYVVGYVLEWSLSLQLNQELQSGEVFVVGFGDPDLPNGTGTDLGPAADGWFVIHDGSMAADNAQLAEYRDGTAKDTTMLSFEELFQTWGRLAGRTNWYNVGPTTITESYTQDGEQLNAERGQVSVDQGKGPKTANKSVTVSLKAEGGAGSLTAEVGSIGVRTFGDVDGIVRDKRAQIATQTVGTTGAYVPVGAVRIDPNERVVTANLTDVTPTAYTGGGALTLTSFAVADSKTDASGFDSPPEQSDLNSVIEQTTNVSTMPDATGTETTNPTDPGGYQLAFGSFQSEKNKGGTAGGGAKVKKRLVEQNDVAVFAVFVPSTGSTGDVTYEYGVELDY